MFKGWMWTKGNMQSGKEIDKPKSMSYRRIRTWKTAGVGVYNYFKYDVFTQTLLESEPSYNAFENAFEKTENHKL